VLGTASEDEFVVNTSQSRLQTTVTVAADQMKGDVCG
jgi:hypothetical protein